MPRSSRADTTHAAAISARIIGVEAVRSWLVCRHR
jgi:hypothetical protein